MNNLKVKETKDYFDLFWYIKILFKESFFSWIWYIFLLILFGFKQTQFFVIKMENKVIGGFFITNFPLMKYKPQVFLKKELKSKITELRKSNYQYFCCFLITRKFRNTGIGTFVFDSYLKPQRKRIYFTSSKKAISFYLRNGCKVYFTSKKIIYIFDS